MSVYITTLLLVGNALALTLRPRAPGRMFLQEHTHPRQLLRDRYVDSQPDTVGLLLGTVEEDIHVWLPLGKRVSTGMDLLIELAVPLFN